MAICYVRAKVAFVGPLHYDPRPDSAPGRPRGDDPSRRCVTLLRALRSGGASTRS